MSIEQLTSARTGLLVLPGAADFDQARLHHGQPGEPAAVARANDVDDVVAALDVARRAGLSVAVRGGGHSTWESVPGAFVLDLRALQGVELDETSAPAAEGARLVHVGGGATWGGVAAELGRHGLAISSGDACSVGVGGLTLGAPGSAGSCAVGVLRSTNWWAGSWSPHAGKCWSCPRTPIPSSSGAFAGAAENFGVATRFDFLAHPLHGMVHASFTLEGPDLPGLIRAFRDVMRSAPRELNGSLVRTPQMVPAVPSRTIIEVAWAGADDAAARKAFAPLVALPQVSSSDIAASTHLDLLQEPPTPPPGMAMPTILDENGWFESLDDGLIDALAAASDQAGGADAHGALARRRVRRGRPAGHGRGVPQRRGVRRDRCVRAARKSGVGGGAGQGGPRPV